MLKFVKTLTWEWMGKSGSAHLKADPENKAEKEVLWVVKVPGEVYPGIVVIPGIVAVLHGNESLCPVCFSLPPFRD
jgi:hypothetical protein